MLQFELGVADETVLDAVRQWIELLVAERYAEAVGQLYQPSDTGGWTPQLVEALVTNYGQVDPRADGKVYRATSTGNAVTQRRINPYQDVEWFPHDSAQYARGVVGFVTFDIPLNGEWSDVTATFLVHKVVDKLLLELEDMHVL